MIKEDFDNAYDSLCQTVYGVDGISYKEQIQKSGKCAELVRADLFELKRKIDSRMKGFVGQIEKHLNIKEYG
tara:strand:+ start:628 stop:843 length:216 start_codon:yes stop_codon:yes gene_type:complete